MVFKSTVLQEYVQSKKKKRSGIDIWRSYELRRFRHILDENDEIIIESLKVF